MNKTTPTTTLFTLFSNAGNSGISEKHSRLRNFFYREIKKVYGAEKHLLKVLPKMAEIAMEKKLKDAICTHFEETKKHVERLEKVFKIMGENVVVKKCEATEGLTKHALEIVINTVEGSATRDVGLILAAQKVAHFEIAAYGGLNQIAKCLGLVDVSRLLAATLDEEKDADIALTGVAENNINNNAHYEVRNKKKTDL